MKRREGTRSDEQGRGGANTTGAWPGSKGLAKTQKTQENGKTKKTHQRRQKLKMDGKNAPKRTENSQFREIGGKNAKKRT